MQTEMTFAQLGGDTSLVDKTAMRLLVSLLTRIQIGQLTLILPEGKSLTFGNPYTFPHSNLKVFDYRFFSRVLLGADVGLGESYMEQEFDTDDLTSLITLLIENASLLEAGALRFTGLKRFVNRILHWTSSNTLMGSRRNIAAHYDLGNDFFKLFLDPSMTYSCALWKDPKETLEEAQRNKRLAIIQKAQIRPSDHILEIGSGWGALAIDAVRETGCRVTTITLSQEQLVYVQNLVKREGLENRITVLLCDYRQLCGSFDKIISVEMLEAVGHQYFGKFFSCLDHLLKPNGLVVIQVITLPDQRYTVYKKGCDWIQKHIFPGSLLPSLTALTHAMTQHSTFTIEALENIGIHYAKTLHNWRGRLKAASNELMRLGFDQRRERTWQYYFSYCEAGFQTRTIYDLQLVLTRPNNRTLNMPEGICLKP